MSQPRVLRIQRTDDGAESYVLIKVEQSGSSPLDLQIVATDGASPFVGQIRQASIGKLQNKNFKGTSQEWAIILSAALLKQKDALTSAEAKEVESVATVNEQQIEIVIRKNVGGITQRLGVVSLQQDDDVAIELFEWTGLAASTSDSLLDEMSRLQSSVFAQQEAVAKLNTQLERLVKAKKDHEDELLLKFTELLNAKKLKIRDQQRLLATAKVDPQAAAQVQASRGTNGHHKAGISRSGKRKVAAYEDDSSDDSDEVPLSPRINDEEDVQADTPQDSDREETEDEDSDDAGFAAAPVPSQSSRQRASRKSNEPATTKPPSPDLELPPRRQLPFELERSTASAKRELPAPASTIAPAQQAVEDEDETDDDEL